MLNSKCQILNNWAAVRAIRYKSALRTFNPWRAFHYYRWPIATN